MFIRIWYLLEKGDYLREVFIRERCLLEIEMFIREREREVFIREVVLRERR